MRLARKRKLGLFCNGDHTSDTDPDQHNFADTHHHADADGYPDPDDYTYADGQPDTQEKPDTNTRSKHPTAFERGDQRVHGAATLRLERGWQD